MASSGSFRGQAATEFFLNYGWAIMIVLAIMAVLYSSIFKPQFYVAERCDIAPGLSCDNFKLEHTTSNNIVLTLQTHNTMGFSINVTRMDFVLTDPTSGNTINSTNATIFGPLKDGDSFMVTVPFQVSDVASPGTLYSIKFSANFTDNDVSPTTIHRTAGIVNVRLSD